MKTSAGLLYGPYDQLIDHIVPFCHMMDLPLIITEPEIEALIQKFYPFSRIERHSYTAAPFKILKQYDQVIAPMSKLLIKEVFFLAEKMLNKELHSIWIPHGNSDKGYTSALRTFVENESTALVYGQRMLDFFTSNFKFSTQETPYFDSPQDDDPQNPCLIPIHNYRYTYFKQHQDKFTPHIVPLISNSRTNILFAPTWCWEADLDKHLNQMQHLIDELTLDYNLIIKIHPRTRRGNPHRIDQFIASHPQTKFLDQFPLIYPLLNEIDLYIGDVSSIGYDYLTFDRPMVFLEDPSLPKEERFLQQCGFTVDQNATGIKSIISQALIDDPYREKRAWLYNHTFQLDTTKQM